MVKESDLSNEGNDLLIQEWDDWNTEFKNSIDNVIEKGTANKEVLWIMKERLDEGDVRPRKKTLEEYFEEQDKLNK